MVRLKPPEGTQELHCQGCGAFLGFFRLADGEFYLHCSRCKSWSALMEGPEAPRLTSQGIVAKLRGEVPETARP